VTQGSGSLGVSATGYTEIVSRSFNTAQLTGVTSSLSIDVFVPTKQPNPYWVGAIQLFATCPAAGIFNTYLGQGELTGLFQGEFNTVTFPTLPSNLIGAFSNPGNSCSLRVALNVNAGSGEYLLDNLAFR
jgi:hypothetical protein